MRQHKALVMDEPSADLVENSKAILQAGVDGCELYQSATQRITWWFCVYKVPMIICTNDWVADGTSPIDASLEKWIQDDSEHVRVTGYLYERA